jgi:hypothetical protein
MREKNLKIDGDKIIWLMAAALFICLPAVLCAQEAGRTQEVPEEKEEIVKKSVSGAVAGISANFIAIEYGVSEKEQSSLEMAFDVDKDVKIAHKKSLKEIHTGDTVEVAYDEIKKIDAQGKVKSSRRLARVIVFVRAAPAPKPESSVLVSGEALEEGQE